MSIQAKINYARDDIGKVVVETAENLQAKKKSSKAVQNEEPFKSL